MFEVQTRRRHRRRSSRNRRREARVATISVIAACAVVAAFVSAVFILAPSKQSRVAPLSAAGEMVIAHDVDLEPARNESTRTVYPFAVISGGVCFSSDIAEGAHSALAVNAHNDDVMPSAMHVETVDEPRAAYMSYRIGDQIYWTKRKLALHDGERVLSDGSVTVRGRCGNRLSDEPMLPTSDAEPPVGAFENEPAPPVVAAPLAALPNDIGPRLSIDPLPPLAPGSLPFIGRIGFFGADTEPSRLTEESPDSWADEVEPPIAFGLPSPPTPGRDVPGPHPTDGGHEDPPTSWEPPTDHPHGGPPLGEPPLHVPNDEVPPPVVPEPTSLALFGTGAAWLAFKRYRNSGRSL